MPVRQAGGKRVETCPFYHMNNRIRGQTKYEIKFYERLLVQKPNYVEALVALADIYTKVGEFTKGLVLDERLAELCPNDETVFYNLACSLSLTGKLKKAYEALRTAVALGYNDFEHLRYDQDLEPLRKSKRYGPVLEKWLSSHPPPP